MADIYKTKSKPFPGTNYTEVYSLGRGLYRQITSRTKRRPYIRSNYFNKEKIFLDYFWDHIRTKNPADRTRRLRQYPCALELLQKSRINPLSKENPNKNSEILHRFSGINANNELFFVQVKESKKTGEKHFMSVFPIN